MNLSNVAGSAGGAVGMALGGPLGAMVGQAVGDVAGKAAKDVLEKAQVPIPVGGDGSAGGVLNSVAQMLGGGVKL